MPKLVVLDGNSLLYRGFFAMKYLSTADGTPTNAVFSFSNMLLHVLDNERPDAIYAAFDPPGGTFRHEEMAGYKGQRKAPPDELNKQRQPARDVAAAFGIPVVEVTGFEADDVCGTLARRGKESGFEVVIVTGDGDALQLVDDQQGPVTVMMTVKGVTDTVIYNEEAVEKRYGLKPAQIPDFKGIKGDTSDNLPGVPGIGEKGASKLLQQYGTVENLIAHAGELPEKQKNTLTEHQDDALMCKRMATILCDIELPETVTLDPDYQTRGPNFAALRDLFGKLEFKQLTKRINDMEREWLRRTGQAQQGEPAPEPERKRIDVPHVTAASAADVDEAVGKLPETPVAVQLHTEPAKASLMEAALHGTVLRLPESVVYIPVEHVTPSLRAFLADPEKPKAVYDLKMVTGVLGRHEIPFAGGVFDALLAAYLINAGKASYPLAPLASDYGGIDLVADPDPVATVLDEAVAIDAIRAPMLERMEKDGLMRVYEEVDLPLAPILAAVEREGVSVNVDLLREVSAKMTEQVAALEAEVFELAGQSFSIGSTKQLQEVLFEKLGLPSGRKTKTGYSTASEVMEDLAAKGHVIARKILQWRELTKLKSTYADTLPTLQNPQTGKIHTTLAQTVAATGRLSSNNPNLQNIPIRSEVGREIRKAFVATPGCVLLSADYSQIELRIFAAITQDEALLESFRKDEDIHARTARRVFGLAEDQPVTSEQRRQAKTINFAVIYGAGPFRVSAELGIPQSEASELIKAYLSSYPGVREWIDKTLEEARKTGYVQTIFGRRRYVPDLLSANYQFRQAAEREAANMPMQGTAADIMKLAMIKTYRALEESGLPAAMVLQVHDELLFECEPDAVPKLADLVRHNMENAYPLDVRLAVEVKSGSNWWEVTPVSPGEPLEALPAVGA